MSIAMQARIAAAVSAVLLAGCGSSSHPSSEATGHSSSTAASPAYSTSAASGGSTSSATPVTIVSKQTKLGTVLAAGPKRLTVYLFEGDRPGTSSCSGACAAAWPPVTGKPQAAGAAVSADLATINRASGAAQVTYKGHPLYFFVKDGDAGDAYGEGVKAFGAQWYALSPTGKSVDNS